MDKIKKELNVGIILAGGKGSRFKAKFPKQFMSLNGKLVIDYVIDAFYESKLFDKIYVVIDKKHKSYVQSNPKISGFIKGGRNRNESVYNAIQHLKSFNPTNVLFHDSARPFIKSSELSQYLINLKKFPGAITSQQITDALYHGDRTKFKLIQTPEAFNFKVLCQSFKINKSVSAIYEHILPKPIKFIELSHSNLKITLPRDMYMAEQLMKYSEATRRESIVKNKNILIIGGTGGIGQALKLSLRNRGAKVTSIGSKHWDLSKSTLVLPSIVRKKKWDCIIHTAGAYAKDSEGLLNNYNKIMNVNFKSIVYLVENIKRIIKPNGSIICISSTAAAKGRTGISIYSASKAALNCFIEGISSTLAKDNIKINVICPAKVNTALQTHINPNADKSKMIQPNDLAKIIIGYIDYHKTGQIVYIRVGEE